MSRGKPKSILRLTTVRELKGYTTQLIEEATRKFSRADGTWTTADVKRAEAWCDEEIERRGTQAPPHAKSEVKPEVQIQTTARTSKGPMVRLGLAFESMEAAAEWMIAHGIRKAA